MTSLNDTSPEEEEADADGVEQDSVEQEEGADKSNCRDRNLALLRLTVA